MKNINCSQCYNQPPRSKQAIIFDKTIEIKNTRCSKNGIDYEELPPDTKLQLSILPTDFCQGSCRFCIASSSIKRHDILDINKLEKALIEIKNRDMLRGVSITGGEPFNTPSLVNEIVNMCFDMFGLECEISINTNGFALDRINQIEKLPFVDAIHISRHHYDEKINESIFGIPMSSNEQLKDFISGLRNKKQIVLNCMLLKDYISTTEDVHRYLDFAISVGAQKASFITGLKVNDYCNNQIVDFEDVIKEDDESMLFTRGFQDYDLCKCQDGIYVNDNGKFIQLYGRKVGSGTCSYARGFVFTPQNQLKLGYNGQVVFG